MQKLITVPLAIVMGLIAVISTICRGFLWLVCLAVTLIVADVLGNTIFLVTGMGRKIRFHSRYFFMARSKWDKPKPISDYMYTRKTKR